MIEFFTFWAFTSVLSLGMDYITAMEFFKKISDRGYKLNLDRTSNFMNKITNNKTGRKIQNTSNISSLIPLYNVAKTLSNTNVLVSNFDYILELMQTLGVVESMLPDELEKYRKRPTLSNAILISSGNIKEKDEKGLKNIKKEKNPLQKDYTCLTLSKLDVKNNKQDEDIIKLLADIHSLDFISNSVLSFKDSLLMIRNGTFIYKDEFISYVSYLNNYNEVLSIIITPNNYIEISKYSVKKCDNGIEGTIDMEEITYDDALQSLISKTNSETKTYKGITIDDLRKKYVNVKYMPGNMKVKNLKTNKEKIFSSINTVRNIYNNKEENIKKYDKIK